RLRDAVQVIHASRAASAEDAPDARLSRISHGSARVYARPNNGTPCRICGGMLEPCAVTADAGLTLAETTTRSFFRKNHSLLQLDVPEDELRLAGDTFDELGRRHMRFQQTYVGLPVWPGE